MRQIFTYITSKAPYGLLHPIMDATRRPIFRQDWINYLQLHKNDS